MSNNGGGIGGGDEDTNLVGSSFSLVTYNCHGALF